jgi:hypothetical protein
VTDPAAGASVDSPVDSPIAAPHRLRDLSQRDLLIAGAIYASVAVAAGVLLWRLRTGDWTQVGDEANQINGAQLAPTWHPMLGDLNTANLYGNPISHHPGPIAWYLLAPWVIVLGPQLGGWLFAISWGLANLMVSGILAYRCGGRRTALVAFVALGLASVLELRGLFASSFFQFTPLLALGTFLLACWAISRSDPWALPIAIFTSTFIVQTASIQGPLLAIVGLASVAAAWLDRRSPNAPPLRAWRWPALAAIGIAGVLWAPPIYDQLFRTGNLGKLVSIEVVHAGGRGAVDVIREAGSMLWVRAPILVALVVAIAIAGARRGGAVLRRGEVILLAAIAVGSLAVGALLPADDVEKTHLHWIAFTLAVLVAIGWSILVGDRTLPRWASVLGAVAMVGAMGTLTFGIASPAAESKRDRSAMRTVLAVEPDVEPWSRERLTIYPRGGWTATRISQGLAPLLHDRRPTVSSGGGRPTPGRSLVVSTPELEVHPNATPITIHRPPLADTVDDDLAAASYAWARANGPIELRPAADTLLAGVVDGHLASICVDEVLADPSQVLELDEHLVLRLYAENLIAAPLLPPELDAQLGLWLAEQPVALYWLEVDEDASWPTGSDELLFTRSSC